MGVRERDWVGAEEGGQREKIVRDEEEEEEEEEEDGRRGLKASERGEKEG